MRLNDYTVPSKEFKVSIKMDFKSTNTGSQTSSTDFAHQGIKPKEVSVSLLIPHKEPQSLTMLTTTAEATLSDGSLKIYTVADETCNAMNIRQVVFSGLSVGDDTNLKAWLVSFELTEYKSVPEKAEQRLPAAVKQAQTATGVSVPVDSDTEEQNTPLTGTEKVLAFWDNLLK